MSEKSTFGRGILACIGVLWFAFAQCAHGQSRAPDLVLDRAPPGAHSATQSNAGPAYAEAELRLRPDKLEARGPGELVLAPNEAYRHMAPIVRALEDRDHELTLASAVAADRAGAFRPLSGNSIGFGYSDARIWLRIAVRNGSAAPRPSVLAFNTAFMHRIDAWLVTREGARHLLHQTEETPFSARPTQDFHLAAPFTLKPGEAGTIYISYWSAGGTAMPVAIETPETIALRRGSVWSVHAAAYSVLGALILFSVLLWAVLRSKIFLLYALHIASVCLFLMHGDGATFRYLWPDWPQWNVVASLPLGLGLNITAALFTRAFLDTNRAYPWIDKAFLAVIGVSALTVVAGLAAFEREAKMVAFPLVVIASLVFLFGGLRALRDRAPGAPFYVLGWASISAAAFLALAANGPLAPGSARATFDLVRGSIVFDALMMALALMVQVTRLRKERDELALRELATMQANMALINRINALEHRHSLAAAAAARSGRTLAVAFHDMREPLLSLRLAVQRLAREPGAAREKAELETSLAYLEGLADTLLVEERAEEAVAASTGGAAKGAETVRAQLVLDTIEHMFAGDAQAKGLRFACVGSTASLRADSVALVRILSNLAAKSVTRTQAGGIVVGCRRRNGRIWLCIVDSGPGRRAEDSTGLGLSMAERLAAQHGFLLEARAIQGGGGFAAVGVLAG